MKGNNGTEKKRRKIQVFVCGNRTSFRSSIVTKDETLIEKGCRLPRPVPDPCTKTRYQIFVRRTHVLFTHVLTSFFTCAQKVFGFDSIKIWFFSITPLRMKPLSPTSPTCLHEHVAALFPLPCHLLPLPLAVYPLHLPPHSSP